MLREYAAGVPHVLSDGIEPPAVSAGADALLDLVEASELPRCQASRLGRRDALAHVLRGGQIEEPTQLVVYLPLSVRSTEQPLNHRGQAMEERHAPSNTPETASAIRSQRRRWIIKSRVPCGTSSFSIVRCSFRESR